MEFSLISTPQQLEAVLSRWAEQGILCVAMDFEEESNLHVYGEHLCTIQLFDGNSYFLIDALALAKTADGLASIKAFLEGPVEKIMFACQSDAALARKTLGIQLSNIFDVRVIAMALGFTGNLNGLIERQIGLSVENPSLKKKYQTANWMRRPIPAEQVEYALGDVRYLFQLKETLLAEMERNLSAADKKKVLYEMARCAEQKNPERPGWEKICNFKLLSGREKVYIKHFFIARDNLARKANVPAARILDKRLIVEMAKRGTWKGILSGPSMRYADTFETARLKAQEEVSTKC
ncbi:MAG: 3'-5' exonuclease [Spirochaetales bacterium]|nr:3'-5' exonuclease [Spirochaetales bacterium]